jgi:hypothetical protein
MRRLDFLRLNNNDEIKKFDTLLRFVILVRICAIFVTYLIILFTYKDSHLLLEL